MEVDFKTEKKDNSQILLTVTIPNIEIKKEYESRLKEIQKEVLFNGFRKGKTPFSVIEARFKKAIVSEMAGKLVDDSFKEIVDKLEKKPLLFDSPVLDGLDKLSLDSDFTYTMLYDAYPDIKYKDFRGMEVEKDEVTVSDADIDDQINLYLKESATFEPKEGKIEKKDIVYVNYKVMENGNLIYSNENECINTELDFDTYKIGGELIGLKKGDNKKFTKKYGEDALESLANKSFDFDVTINEVKKEVIPKLTDEICPEIDPECKTIAELKDKMINEHKKSGEDYVKNKVVEKVMDSLVETFEGEIPESMITEHLRSSLEQISNLAKGNKEEIEAILAKDGANLENYSEKMREKAALAIKKALIMQDIVKNQNYDTKTEEILAHLEKISGAYKVSAEQLYNFYESQGRISSVIDEIENKKTIDVIYNSLKLKKGKTIKFSDIGKEEK
ncbi:MAG TPA: trigger factor [Spirochaetota bacterium]|mgnify:FL=1|jgi:trigger factor|nr:MAG: Trigger factor [Spirochaetes bacterium ADurb.Bin133]HNZ27158.1 trigger factor [Spirochaetota bacterium]HPY86900.1 trigger factor [Spirochaetota bacterium]